MTTPRGLDVYDVAFLTGGVQRVVDTALVALIESGRVRVHAPRELAAVRPDRRHPVEGAVLDALGTRGHPSVDTIRWRAARDERLTGIGRSLSQAGLLRRRMLHGRGTWCPTRTGREALRHRAAQPPVDGSFDVGSAPLVALHGYQAMADVELRTAVFDRPSLSKEDRRDIRRRLRGAARENRARAAYDIQNAGAGGAAVGFMGGAGDAGWGVDGGGD
jgi:hypothetical protein